MLARRSQHMYLLYSSPGPIKLWKSAHQLAVYNNLPSRERKTWTLSKNPPIIASFSLVLKSHVPTVPRQCVPLVHLSSRQAVVCVRRCRALMPVGCVGDTSLTRPQIRIASSGNSQISLEKAFVCVLVTTCMSLPICRGVPAERNLPCVEAEESQTHMAIARFRLTSLPFKPSLTLTLTAVITAGSNPSIPHTYGMRDGHGSIPRETSEVIEFQVT